MNTTLKPYAAQLEGEARAAADKLQQFEVWVDGTKVGYMCGKTGEVSFLSPKQQFLTAPQKAEAVTACQRLFDEQQRAGEGVDAE